MDTKETKEGTAAPEVATAPAEQPATTTTEAADGKPKAEKKTKKPEADTDSVGKEKSDKTPLGPRGVNKPRDMKPAPKLTKADTSTVTEAIDSAGSVKADTVHLGPRGSEAHHVRDSYKPLK